MSRFERRVLSRFAGAAGRILLLLAWLALILELPKALARGETFAPEELLGALARYLSALEIALAVAAPLGMIAALLELKRAGILTAFCGAGLDVRRLRRVLLVAAAGTLLVAAGLFEVRAQVHAASHPGAQARLWKAGGVNVWAREYDPYTRALSRVVLFRDEGLDVSLAEEGTYSAAEGTWRLTPPRVLAGAPLALAAFADEPEHGDLFSPPGLSLWLAPSTSASAILAAVNRLLLGGCLVLLFGYLSLLAPLERQGGVYLAFLLLAPAAILVLLWCTILLWSGGAAGYLAEAGALLATVGAVVLAERAFSRRGIRLA